MDVLGLVPAALLLLEVGALAAWVLPAMVAAALIVLGILGFVLGSWGAAVRRAEIERRKQDEQDLILQKQAETERARDSDSGVS